MFRFLILYDYLVVVSCTYAAVTSAAAFLAAVQSVLLNLRMFFCGFLVLDVVV